MLANKPLLIVLALLAAEPETMQPQDASPEIACGPSALSMAARLVDRPVDRQQLNRACGGELNRIYSLWELQQAAEKLGLLTKAVRNSTDDRHRPALPMIVALTDTNSKQNGSHFVVLYGAANGRVQLLDYPHPPRLVSAKVLAEHWDGRGLYIAAESQQLTQIAGNTTPDKWIARGAWIMLGFCVLGFVFVLRVPLLTAYAELRRPTKVQKD